MAKADCFVMCVTAPNSDKGHYSPGHAGHQTLQAFLVGIGPLIKQGLAEFMEVMWGMIHVVDCAPQFVPQKLDGVAVRGLCRPVHFSDVPL